LGARRGEAEDPAPKTIRWRVWPATASNKDHSANGIPAAGVGDTIPGDPRQSTQAASPAGRPGGKLTPVTGRCTGSGKNHPTHEPVPSWGRHRTKVVHPRRGDDWKTGPRGVPGQEMHPRCKKTAGFCCGGPAGQRMWMGNIGKRIRSKGIKHPSGSTEGPSAPDPTPNLHRAAPTGPGHALRRERRGRPKEKASGTSQKKTPLRARVGWDRRPRRPGPAPSSRPRRRGTSQQWLALPAAGERRRAGFPMGAPETAFSPCCRRWKKRGSHSPGFPTAAGDVVLPGWAGLSAADGGPRPPFPCGAGGRASPRVFCADGTVQPLYCTWPCAGSRWPHPRVEKSTSRTRNGARKVRTRVPRAIRGSGGGKGGGETRRRNAAHPERAGPLGPTSGRRARTRSDTFHFLSNERDCRPRTGSQPVGHPPAGSAGIGGVLDSYRASVGGVGARPLTLDRAFFPTWTDCPRRAWMGPRGAQLSGWVRGPRATDQQGG